MPSFWSELKDEVKKAIVDSEGRVTRSEVHITNTVTDERITLSMCPEEIKARTATSFRTYNIIERGEVKIPKGEELTSFSWQGIFPGAGILLYSYVKHDAWERPSEIVRALTRWREQGNKLKLLITQTLINHDVYLKDLDIEYSGIEHIKYTVNFVVAKELKILTVEEADAKRARQKDSTQYEIKRRAAMKSKAGLYIQSVNSVWEVCQILTGNGGNWEELLNRNGIIDPFEIDGTMVYN